MGVNDWIAFPAGNSPAQELFADAGTSQLGSPPEPHYLFYCYICDRTEGGENAGNASAGGLSAPYSWTIWRPQPWPALPHGRLGFRLRLRFLFRWSVHRMHLFAGSGSGALLIYDGGRLVHYSAFTPRYWRFPFVADDDFQIGDTWTHRAYRGRGLAIFALRTILAMLAKPGRRLWYVVEAINAPSIRVAEKAQFRLTAEGTWITPRGIKLAGAYVIRRKNCSA